MQNLSLGRSAVSGGAEGEVRDGWANISIQRERLGEHGGGSVVSIALSAHEASNRIFSTQKGVVC